MPINNVLPGDTVYIARPGQTSLVRVVSIIDWEADTVWFFDGGWAYIDHFFSEYNHTEFHPAVDNLVKLYHASPTYKIIHIHNGKAWLNFENTDRLEDVCNLIPAE